MRPGSCKFNRFDFDRVLLTKFIQVDRILSHYYLPSLVSSNASIVDTTLEKRRSVHITILGR